MGGPCPRGGHSLLHPLTGTKAPVQAPSRMLLISAHPAGRGRGSALQHSNRGGGPVPRRQCAVFNGGRHHVAGEKMGSCIRACGANSPNNRKRSVGRAGAKGWPSSRRPKLIENARPARDAGCRLQRRNAGVPSSSLRRSTTLAPALFSKIGVPRLSWNREKARVSSGRTFFGRSRAQGFGPRRRDSPGGGDPPHNAPPWSAALFNKKFRYSAMPSFRSSGEKSMQRVNEQKNKAVAKKNGRKAGKAVVSRTDRTPSSRAHGFSRK